MCEILILKQTKKKTSKCRAERQTIIGLNVEKKNKDQQILIIHLQTTAVRHWQGGARGVVCVRVCVIWREKRRGLSHITYMSYSPWFGVFFFSSEENVNISPQRVQQQCTAVRGDTPTSQCSHREKDILRRPRLQPYRTRARTTPPPGPVARNTGNLMTVNVPGYGRRPTLPVKRGG